MAYQSTSAIKSVIDLNDTTSTIKWRLTDACNYRCSYCVRAYLARAKQDVQQLKDDWTRCKKAAPAVNRIINAMPGTVKIDLIGGEVSLYNLEELLVEITSPKLIRINITTNLSRPADYYIRLIKYCRERNILLGLTASFHSEYETLPRFFQKAQSIRKESAGALIFTLEMVSRTENQEQVKLFIKKCEFYEFDYLVEKDIKNGRQNDSLIKCAKKRTNARYKIIYSDNSVRFYYSRNDFITLKDKEHQDGLGFKTKGFYCYRDVNYTYIDRDQHMGKLRIAPDNPQAEKCLNLCPIEQFTPLKEPTICQSQACTLCGHITVSKERLPEIEKPASEQQQK